MQQKYNKIVEKILEDKKKPFFSFGDSEDSSAKTVPKSSVKNLKSNTKAKISNGHLKNLELLDSLEEDY